MGKKIAVLVRGRQSEALRMSVGLTLADDTIDVFVLDGKVEETENNTLNLETMKDMDMKVYTNFKGNADMEYLSTEEMAKKLLEYDNIIPY
jgi:putative sterol carrier protein